MKTITAMFDNYADAVSAQGKIIASGVAASQVSLVKGESSTTAANTGYDHTSDEHGFWASLKDMFMPEDDRYTYAEGMSRGGTVLTVQTDAAHETAVMDIVEEHGSVDLDAREDQWRKEGWRGYQPSATGLAGAPAGAPVGMAATKTMAATDNSGTDYIPVMEETLRVGKRATESGRVKLRSYVVETPVSEQVSLHNETVTIDRRPVDRVVTAADAMLFKDKTIEVVAHSEEAVVAKDVRVTEEIGIRKEHTDRVQTIEDSVRSTKVEIDDGKGGSTRPDVKIATPQK